MITKFIALLQSKGTLPFYFRTRKSTEHMTKVILTGSYIANTLILLLLIMSYIFIGNEHVINRIFISLIIFVYLFVISFSVYKNHLKLSAWMLVTLYSTAGIYTLSNWSINSPIGVLILGFVIVLTSVMLGSKHIPLVTIAVIGSLFSIQTLALFDFINPDSSMLDNASSFGDAAGYSIIFAIFATIAWLSGRKTEQTLERAIKAEKTLQKERDDLANRVKQQTQSIVAAQQKELKQLYKFAELGQLTTIILHDLANHLSILTLDIEDLHDRHRNSIAIKNAKESISHIDTMIDQVRSQIMVSENVDKFDALLTLRETIIQLQKKHKNADIQLFTQDEAKRDYILYGDPLRLSQVSTILINNAIQATKNHPKISITAGSVDNKIMLSFKDSGTGIPQETRHNLFNTHKSSKGAGLGIGLYISKQVIETHFKGKIWLSSATEYTEFNIEIPFAKK